MRAVRALAKDKKKFRGGTFLAALGGIYRLLDLLVALALLPSDLNQLWEEHMGDETLSVAAWVFLVVGIGLVIWSLVDPTRRFGDAMEAVPVSDRSITTHGQTGGFNNTGDNLTVNFEDRSLKRRLRNLFQEIDPRILSRIDAGEMSITTRMMDYQFARFADLCAENGASELIDSADRGPTSRGATIINGSLGPTASGDQIPVQINLNSSIME
mgnify:FL=1